MSTDDSAEVAMVGIRCRHCGAGPGEWCFTSSGFRASYLHSARFYDWRESAEDVEAPESNYLGWSDWPDAR